MSTPGWLRTSSTSSPRRSPNDFILLISFLSIVLRVLYPLISLDICWCRRSWRIELVELSRQLVRLFGQCRHRFVVRLKLCLDLFDLGFLVGRGHDDAWCSCHCFVTPGCVWAPVRDRAIRPRPYLGRASLHPVRLPGYRFYYVRWSERLNSNQRPPASKTGTLTGLSYSQKFCQVWALPGQSLGGILPTTTRIPLGALRSC